jgi:RimJ/RimL family protein N-acetyltransferase
MNLPKNWQKNIVKRMDKEELNLSKRSSILLQGDKLYMRLVSPDDAHPIYLNWLNDEKVTAGLETIVKPYTMAMLESYIQSAIQDTSGYLFMIHDRATNVPIGTGRLHSIHPKYATCNLGLMIGNTDFWGKGYGKEAYRLMIDYAFNALNIRRIWDLAHATNTASIAMCESLGFKREGVLREHILTPNGPMDKVVLGLLKKEWKG